MKDPIDTLTEDAQALGNAIEQAVKNFARRQPKFYPLVETNRIQKGISSDGNNTYLVLSDQIEISVKVLLKPN